MRGNNSLFVCVEPAWGFMGTCFPVCQLQHSTAENTIREDRTFLWGRPTYVQLRPTLPDCLMQESFSIALERKQRRWWNGTDKKSSFQPVLKKNGKWKQNMQSENNRKFLTALNTLLRWRSYNSSGKPRGTVQHPGLDVEDCDRKSCDINVTTQTYT